jgi:RNA recognition motif-containing protein
VEKVNLITDRDTGRAKGFAFVEMRMNAEANQAIQALNGRDVGGRALNVNEARPREERGGAAAVGIEVAVSVDGVIAISSFRDALPPSATKMTI